MKVIIVIELLLFSVFLTDRDHYYIYLSPWPRALFCPVSHLEMAEWGGRRGGRKRPGECEAEQPQLGKADYSWHLRPMLLRKCVASCTVAYSNSISTCQRLKACSSHWQRSDHQLGRWNRSVGNIWKAIGPPFDHMIDTLISTFQGFYRCHSDGQYFRRRVQCIMEFGESVAIF